MSKRKIVCILFSVICSLAVFGDAAVLADQTDNINIVGDVRNNLALTADNTFIFKKNNVVPGESWTTNINITNKSAEELQVSLLEIKNNLPDETLANAMLLEIAVDGAIVYQGSYGKTEIPVIEDVTVNAKETVIMSVKAGVDSNAGNNIQNCGLDSTWVFEGKTQKSGNKNTVASNKSSHNRSGPIAGNWSYNIMCENVNGESLMNTMYSATIGSTVLVQAPKINGYEPTVPYKVLNVNTPDKDVVFTYHKIGAENKDYEKNEENGSGINEMSEANREDESNVNAGENMPERSEKDDGEKYSQKLNREDKNQPVNTGNEKMLSDTAVIPLASVAVLLLGIVAVFCLRRYYRKKNKKKDEV